MTFQGETHVQILERENEELTQRLAAAEARWEKMKIVGDVITRAVDDTVADLRQRLAAAEAVAHWAQAVLTGLNVGDVMSESPLHKKLREVMIAYREKGASNG